MMLEYLILEMTMEMGFPLEIEIPRNPMGIGTKNQLLLGMGRSGNERIWECVTPVAMEKISTDLFYCCRLAVGSFQYWYSSRP